MEKKADDALKAKRSKVIELDNNIKLLAESMHGRQDRLTYYTNMLVDSNKQPTHKTTGARGNKPKSSAAEKRQASTIEFDTAGSNSLGVTAGAFGGRRGLQQTAFNQYLIGLGGNREEVKGINDTILDLIDKARDKQEDGLGERDGGRKFMTEQEMITALKKVEIKFQELEELRKVFNFFDENNLKKHELDIKMANKDRKTTALKLKKARELEQHEAKLQARIKVKKNLVVAKNIRTTFRSRKPEHNVKKEETVKVPPEVEEMKRYLGIVPDDWNVQAQQTQDKK